MEVCREFHGQYEWSVAGMQLLQTIHQIIDDNGGYEKMLESVVMENTDNLYRRDTLIFKEKILKMHNRIHCKDIPGILGISDSRYRIILEKMGLIGKGISRSPKIRANSYEF